MKKSWLTLSALALFGVAGIAYAVVRGSDDDQRQVPKIEIIRAPFHATVRAAGELKSKSALTVSAKRTAGALVVAWLAPEGSQVEVGDVVVEFESHQAREKLYKADAEVRKIDQEIAKHRVKTGARRTDLKAEATRTRISRDQAAFKAGLADGIVPQIELDEARMDLRLAEMDLGRVERSIEAQRPKDEAALALLSIRLEKAKNQRGQAQNTLDSTKVEAESPGVVSYKSIWKQGGFGKVAPGDSIWPGRPVVDLVDLSQVEFVAQVREEDAVRVANEQKVVLVLPAIQGTTTGSVRQVAAVAQQPDPRSPLKYIEVKIELDERTDELRAGLTGQVEIQILAEESAIAVSREAVSADGDKRFVFVEQGDGHARREVTLGPESESAVMIIAGLEEGDTIYARDPTKTKEEIAAERVARQKEARKKRKTTGGGGSRTIIMF